MHEYETVLILSPHLDQPQIEARIDKVKNFIIEKEGEIIEVKLLSNQKLAYPIKKQEEGHYVFLNYRAVGEVVNKIRELFQFDEAVLRLLSFKKEKPLQSRFMKRLKRKTVKT